MHLRVKNTEASYKSINKNDTKFTEVDLPDFTVITGLNGSGKTHLLEAIKNGTIEIDDVNVNNDEIRLFNWLNLVPNDSGRFDLGTKRNNDWNQLSSNINQVKQPFQGAIENLENQVNTNLNKANIYTIYMMTEDQFIQNYGDSPQNKSIYTNIKNQLNNIETQIINRFSNNNQDKDRKKFINYLRSQIDCHIINLTEDIFNEKYLSISIPVNMFQQSFGQLFISYWEKFNTHRLETLDRYEKEKNIDVSSHEIFYEQNGKPPWEFVNQILNENNLEFRIDKPEKYNAPYEPKLIHQVTKEKIRFNSLSSGEKILMSFALCLYYTSDKRQTVNYSKVLLFDEIDAPLHPSMTLSVLNTIQKTLVEEQKIKVILTTHSPSTVALSPESSIYVMDKETRCLQKTTKDKALSLLTSGIPTLSVNYKNRKQVFVESEYDAKYYDKIYKKLTNKLNTDISLNFINIGVEGENCEQVKDIVKKLKHGNNNIYGIIDWDLKNQSNKDIKVLGENKRYTIENYIFDPLLIGIFLLIKNHDKFYQEFNLPKKDENLGIVNIVSYHSQKIINSVIEKLSINFDKDTILDEKIECKYVNKCQVKIPKWFLQNKGHDLLGLLTNTFNELKEYTNRQEKLKNEILHKVLNFFPELISVDFLHLFQDIQNDDPI